MLTEKDRSVLVLVLLYCTAAGGSPAVGAAVPPARALGMSTEVGILLDDLD